METKTEITQKNIIGFSKVQTNDMKFKESNIFNLPLLNKSKKELFALVESEAIVASLHITGISFYTQTNDEALRTKIYELCRSYSIDTKNNNGKWKAQSELIVELKGKMTPKFYDIEVSNLDCLTTIFAIGRLSNQHDVLRNINELNETCLVKMPLELLTKDSENMFTVEVGDYNLVVLKNEINGATVPYFSIKR